MYESYDEYFEPFRHKPFELFEPFRPMGPMGYSAAACQDHGWPRSRYLGDLGQNLDFLDFRIFGIRNRFWVFQTWNF